jgi:hypothetical protein
MKSRQVLLIGLDSSFDVGVTYAEDLQSPPPYGICAHKYCFLNCGFLSVGNPIKHLATPAVIPRDFQLFPQLSYIPIWCLLFLNQRVLYHEANN